MGQYQKKSYMSQEMRAETEAEKYFTELNKSGETNTLSMASLGVQTSHKLTE